MELIIGSIIWIIVIIVAYKLAKDYKQRLEKQLITSAKLKMFLPVEFELYYKTGNIFPLEEKFKELQNYKENEEDRKLLDRNLAKLIYE